MVGHERPFTFYLRAWAGVIVGAAAWGISTQLNYALAPLQCSGAAVVPWTALALAVIAAAGGVMSLAWRGQDRTGEANEVARFIVILSVLLSAIFTLVILLQALAGLVFTGCEP